jgi:hypothetical protein
VRHWPRHQLLRAPGFHVDPISPKRRIVFHHDCGGAQVTLGHLPHVAGHLSRGLGSRCVARRDRVAEARGVRGVELELEIFSIADFQNIQARGRLTLELGEFGAEIPMIELQRVLGRSLDRGRPGRCQAHGLRPFLALSGGQRRREQHQCHQGTPHHERPICFCHITAPATGRRTRPRNSHRRPRYEQEGLRTSGPHILSAIR